MEICVMNLAGLPPFHFPNLAWGRSPPPTGVRGYHLLVSAGLNESVATRRVFFTCGGGAPTTCDRRRQRTENILKQV